MDKTSFSGHCIYCNNEKDNQMHLISKQLVNVFVTGKADSDSLLESTIF